MRIELQLNVEAASVIRARAHSVGGDHSAAERLVTMLTALGLDLQPVHPGTVPLTLAPFFSIEVPDEAAARRVVDRLRAMEGVEAAYLRPDNELP